MVMRNGAADVKNKIWPNRLKESIDYGVKFRPVTFFKHCRLKMLDFFTVIESCSSVTQPIRRRLSSRRRDARFPGIARDAVRWGRRRRDEGASRSPETEPGSRRRPDPGRRWRHFRSSPGTCGSPPSSGRSSFARWPVGQGNEPVTFKFKINPFTVWAGKIFFHIGNIYQLSVGADLDQSIFRGKPFLDHSVQDEQNWR